MKSKLKTAYTWIVDTPPRVHSYMIMHIYRNRPKHYLEHVLEGKQPIVVLQGLNNKWSVLKGIVDPFSKLGHPVYVFAEIGLNRKPIEETAHQVYSFLEKENLKNALIIAHSKGGLVGKYMLSLLDKDNRIEKLIAIATPFWGSRLADRLKFKTVQEFRTDSKIIRLLAKHTKENEKIISIYPKDDNMVIHENKSCLEGAENYELKVRGHHKILKSKELGQLLRKII